MILHGDAMDILEDLPAAHVDALVTDPPAGISFMGKTWDADHGGRDHWIAWLRRIMQECHRVMKPGAHGLVWALPRTSHWTATALEDAGFEVRDVICHVFGSGFPKSLDVSKAIDKAAGAKRDVVGPKTFADGSKARKTQNLGGNSFQDPESRESNLTITAPATDDAKRWRGWGTALKPASEHWILIRKPLSEKTVAANVLKHGTGAINIDGCRVETSDALAGSGKNPLSHSGQNHRPYHDDPEKGGYSPNGLGRFPANLVLSCCGEEPCVPGCAVAEMDRQSGVLKSGTSPGRRPGGMGYHGSGPQDGVQQRPANEGGASRFFYVAKPSKREKNAGTDGNGHPTVKPVKLMRYLARLVTPPGGLVLDPFTGSGTTAVAAVQEGFRFLGIEREAEYVEIARARLEHAEREAQGQEPLPIEIEETELASKVDESPSPSPAQMDLTDFLKERG